MRQAKTDIDAVYSMGLFDDVTILPQPSDDSTPEQPKASDPAAPSVYSQAECSQETIPHQIIPTLLCITQVDLTLNIVERKTGGLSCGGGISSQGHSEGALPGFIGSASFSQRNLFGLNQKLAATLEIGQVSTWELQLSMYGKT